MNKVHDIMNEYYDEETQEDRNDCFFSSSFLDNKNLSGFISELNKDFTKSNFNKLFDEYFYQGGGEIAEANELKRDLIKRELFE